MALLKKKYLRNALFYVVTAIESIIGKRIEKWCPPSDSNRPPTHYKCVALPNELGGRPAIITYLFITYIVTSKPKRISVAAGLVHIMYLLVYKVYGMYTIGVTLRFVYTMYIRKIIKKAHRSGLFTTRPN